MTSQPVAVIGAGLAGSEAALVLARAGIPVELFEQRPHHSTPAHTTDLPAELVCSNSLKSMQLPSAHALLKKELGILESPLLREARAVRVPAGSALAVDRTAFARRVLECLAREERITLIRRECARAPEGYACCIVAAGPLVSDALAGWLMTTFSSNALHFYDAIAPIIAADSVDMSVAFFANRREREGTDYLNCPFSETEFRRFHRALVDADRVAARAFENARFFEACLPVEVVAQRGPDALAFGTLKPVGLTDPRTGRRPYAVCQLRRENAPGESLGMVGFQTRLTQKAQREVFRLIPGLAHAEFLRYGSIHRNTYLDGPDLLTAGLSFAAHPAVFLAGQLCGNEGYTESIATGHLAALSAAARMRGGTFEPPPPTTACGALLRHVTASREKPFTPSNINFGLIDPLGAGGKRIGKHDKRRLLCERAVRDLTAWRRSSVRDTT
ncbi:MAG: methylenetetrahydrofolate--tRNA-(uracil(54)-C(5))-methyltransferase (FADH(2)-oxidizing) TrmFO [Chitinivibrionales bacterium]|nr:methylenetetrahydrofolate--tRNA-(uracil(54)-C(5))-methyltransferase (FADH(2)-oxidizing) TrmFO [Chitinivibrionales bacterium]MBD3394886.1 methylenetetrahydrofolate--tRNA-(uracil(54)-C(5))-methyltransferase (FADH(2)-oxidizing) TrmFO [Chitinivibrionales bacterium]